MTKANGRRGRITQVDVAQLAGVSRALVSQILNNNTTLVIPQETRTRVQSAMHELGYVPDRAAQSLRTRKTYTIASIIPDITNPFYPAFQRGIQDVTREHNYELIMYNTDGDFEQERRCLLSAQGRVDGVIAVLFRVSNTDLLALAESGMAIVRIGGIGPMSPPIDHLDVNDEAAAYTAVSYLISRGYTRIGMLAGQEGTPPHLLRIAGYRRALAEHHLPLDEILIQDGDFNEDGGYRGMQALLKLTPRPSAVFAANDLMAIGALKAIREAGLRVPEDIAIVGYDDIPAANQVFPRLTTISQFQDALGRRAAEMLFERLSGDGPPEGRYESHPFELVVRESA